MADTESLLAEALQAINDSRDGQSLDAIRVNYLGKKEYHGFTEVLGAVARARKTSCWRVYQPC